MLSRDLDGGRARHLIALASQKRIPFQQVPPEALSRVAGNSIQHQGVAARMAAAPMPPAEELLDQLAADALVVVLDGVEDPRNLGAVLRSAAGFGVAAVFVPDRRSAPLSPAAVRTAAGGAELVPVGRAHNLGQLLDRLRDRGFRVIALDVERAEPLWQADWSGPIALVAGGEEKGVRPSIRSRCDLAVRIPVVAEIGSLNVSVAVGIALSEATRQRGGLLQPPRN